jgi:hypothetical protein
MDFTHSFNKRHIFEYRYEPEVISACSLLAELLRKPNGVSQTKTAKAGVAAFLWPD